MKKKEKQPKYVGLEKLSSLGGFISDAIEKSYEEELSKIYSERIIDVVLPYCPMGPRFKLVADEVVKLYDELSDIPIHFRFDFDEREKVDELKNVFMPWALDMLAKFESMRILNPDQFKEPRIIGSPRLRRVTGRLNALDRVLLYYSRGLYDGKKLTAKEIAALPEFNCAPRLVGRELQRMGKRFKQEAGDRVMQEFDGFCEMYRNEYQNGGNDNG